MKTNIVTYYMLVFLLISLPSCREKTKQENNQISLLKVSKENPRYFADQKGNIVYLTGSHTWANLVDISTDDPPKPFDFNAYLDWMQKYNHNFIRLWAMEVMNWKSERYNPGKSYTVYPHPWKRTGPGNAIDGKAKFNLNEFEEEYFNRLRNRIETASKRGIYISVMLFEGWGMQFSLDGWKNHPFHPDNNINGINADLNRDGNGLELYDLSVPEVTDIQKKYISHVIDMVNEFDNVLYEISNENHPPSTQWQYLLINFIHDYEKNKPKQHPVGMTFQYKGGSNDTLLASPAEWISPNPFFNGKDLRNDPPAADGKKVILYDTDHLWGLGGNQPWVWKTFTRGMYPLFMDPYDGVFIGDPNTRGYEQIRKNMGYARMYAGKIDLAQTIPANELTSTTYCLANPGSEYIVYQPLPDSSFTVNLKKGRYSFEWFNPGSGIVESTGKVRVRGENTLFKAPFSGDAVLYLKAF